MAPRPTTRELALLGAFAFFFFFTSSAHNAALDRGRSYFTSTENSKGIINSPWANDSPSSINPSQPAYLDAARRTWGSGLPPETKILAHTPGSTLFYNVY